MILTYRQRLIIHNLIDAKLTEIESLNLDLNTDANNLKEFAKNLLNYDTVRFSRTYPPL